MSSIVSATQATAPDPELPIPTDSLQDIFRTVAEEWAQLHRDTLRFYMDQVKRNTLPIIRMYVPSEKNMSAIEERMTLEIQNAIFSITAPEGNMPFTTVENTPELAARVAKVLSEKPAVTVTATPEPPKEREAGKVYTEKEMKAMTVTDLKAVCKSFGLTTSGKKDDIIKRITTYSINLIAEEVSLSEAAPEPDQDSESDADADLDPESGNEGSDLELVDPELDSSDAD